MVQWHLLLLSLFVFPFSLPLLSVSMGHVADRGQDRLNSRTAENWQETINKWACKSLKEKHRNTVHCWALAHKTGLPITWII